jgi:hypothetical protein
MAQPQIFELSHGQMLSTAAVGKTIVHRPVRDVGTPLFLGLLYGVPALGLVVAAAVMIAGGGSAVLLVGLALLFASFFGWLAAGLLAGALAARRFNRRNHEVRFGLRDVEVRGPDGVERVALAEAQRHRFLQSLAIDGRFHRLVRVRATCMQLASGDDVRVVLETFALLELDEREGSESSGPSSGQPRWFAVVTGGEASFMRDPEGVEEGTPLYRVAAAWDPAAKVWQPRLTPAGVRRV